MKILKSKKYSILSNILKYGFVFAFMFALMAPVVFAIKCPDNSDRVSCPDGALVSAPATATGGVQVGGGKDSVIENPLGSKLNDLPSFIEAIIKIVLVVGVPILALAIIYAGFLFVKAQGNPGELEVAKRTLLYTVIGGALLLGAFVIANAIGSTVKEISNGV